MVTSRFPKFNNKNSMKRVFITRKIPSIAEDMLKKQFEVQINPEERQLTHDELIEAAQAFDGILSMLSDPFTPAVFERATRLKVVSNFAIGLDNIDQAAARIKKIVVTNLPDVVTESTADLTFALLLSLIRKIPQAKEYVLEGRWRAYDPNLFTGEELQGKTFGIMGFGRTGRAVAKRALPFGLKVNIYHYKPLTFSQNEPYTQVPFDVLLSTSDYISLHIPLKEETRFLIDATAFSQMHKHPVLINMARGAVVQTDALVTALETGQIRGAALDVTFPEPLSHHHPLCLFENCLIVPHIGSATTDCRNAMARLAAQNLIDHLL